jgi:hypothetical protein
VAISNARLVSANARTVAFRWKDYRIKSGDRQMVMRLAMPEFIRRFLIHVLPDGFYRIRHYGLLASSTRKSNITKVRALLCVQRPEQATAAGAWRARGERDDLVLGSGANSILRQSNPPAPILILRTGTG